MTDEWSFDKTQNAHISVQWGSESSDSSCELHESGRLSFHVCVTKKNNEAITDRLRERERTAVIAEVAETTREELICLRCYLQCIYQTVEISDGWRKSLKNKRIQTAQRSKTEHWRGRNSRISRQLWQEQIHTVLLIDNAVVKSMFFKNE